MVVFVIVVIIGISCLATLKKITNRVTSISGVFVCLWTITLSFASLGLYDMNIPNKIVIVLSTMSIIIFTIIGCLFKKPTKTLKGTLFKKSFESKPLAKKTSIYVFSGMAYVYSLPFLIKSIKLIQKSGLSILRDVSEMSSYASTAQLMILQYFVQSLFVATILVTCIDIVNKKVYLPSILLSFADTIIYIYILGCFSWIFVDISVFWEY